MPINIQKEINKIASLSLDYSENHEEIHKIIESIHNNEEFLSENFTYNFLEGIDWETGTVIDSEELEDSADIHIDNGHPLVVVQTKKAILCASKNPKLGDQAICELADEYEALGATVISNKITIYSENLDALPEFKQRIKDSSKLRQIHNTIDIELSKESIIIWAGDSDLSEVQDIVSRMPLESSVESCNHRIPGYKNLDDLKALDKLEKSMKQKMNLASHGI